MQSKTIAAFADRPWFVRLSPAYCQKELSPASSGHGTDLFPYPRTGGLASSASVFHPSRGKVGCVLTECILESMRLDRPGETKMG